MGPSASIDSDEDLMLRFGRGDAAAFEALYGRHESKVFRYLYRNVRDQAVANDLMQDVWFAVARSAQRYQPSAKFTTWLFTLAHNRMVDMLRVRRPVQSLDGVDAAGGGASLADRLVADGNKEPLAELMSEDEAAVLLRAVGALPAE